MSKKIELISAAYIGNYNDTTVYKAILNYDNSKIDIEIEEHYHDMEVPDKTWEITSSVNISDKEKEEILKIIAANKPIHFPDAEPKIYNKEINIINNERNEELLAQKNNVEFIYNFLKRQNDTGWIDLEELKTLQDKKYVLPGDTPRDLQRRLDELLEKLWIELEDIPFKEIEGVEYLDDNYIDFEVGETTKEDIWHWFDDRHSKGIHYLLYEYDKENDKQAIYYTEVNERIPEEKRDKELHYYECRTCDGETTIERKVTVDFSGMLITSEDILGDKEYIEKEELFNDPQYEFFDDSDIYDKVYESGIDIEEIENSV